MPADGNTLSGGLCHKKSQKQNEVASEQLLLSADPQGSHVGFWVSSHWGSSSSLSWKSNYKQPFGGCSWQEIVKKKIWLWVLMEHTIIQFISELPLILPLLDEHNKTRSSPHSCVLQSWTWVWIVFCGHSFLVSIKYRHQDCWCLHVRTETIITVIQAERS